MIDIHERVVPLLGPSELGGCPTTAPIECEQQRRGSRIYALEPKGVANQFGVGGYFEERGLKTMGGVEGQHPRQVSQSEILCFLPALTPRKHTFLQHYRIFRGLRLAERLQ